MRVCTPWGNVCMVNVRAGNPCVVDALAGCDLYGKDLNLFFHPHLRNGGGQNPWVPKPDQISFEEEPPEDRFSWVGPRSCRCMQAWLQQVGPHAPELKHGIEFPCLLVNSTARVIRNIEYGRGARCGLFSCLRQLLNSVHSLWVPGLHTVGAASIARAYVTVVQFPTFDNGACWTI